MPGGRRPFTTTDVTPWQLGNQRLRPPAHLGDRERAAFLDLISSCPLAQFTPADIPLLCRWCELELQAQTAAAELREHGMMIKGKPSPWLAIHAQALKGQSLLALRLRLGPQSRANKAPKTQPARMSFYERMELEEGDGDAQ
jgi:phage terminase small subunit